VGGGAVDPALARRLEAVGLEPAAFGEPAAAWRLLREQFGRRVTLVDRYALEAAHRGVAPESLDEGERERLVREVAPILFPKLERAPGAGWSRDPVELVPYRAEWPTDFARRRERLLAELGPTAIRIEHVGSTAVPGLAAKPVVDIQVSVPDVEDVSAFRPAIERAGVSFRLREAEHCLFRPPDGEARTVHVHVCAAGSDWEREHLLFRDYLLAHPDACAAYVGVKRELTERYRGDRLAYTEGKTAFVLDTLEAAEEWAGRVGWRLPPAIADHDAS
jgi:GrpB-like predicted nucleotidyltransferase (UPF0157 family)